MVTLVRQEVRSSFEDRSHILIDTTGTGHTCEISKGGVLLDGILVHVVLDVPGYVAFVSGDEKIVCTSAALWYTFAGADVSPTATDAGQQLAENIARWTTIQQSLVLIQAFEGQAKTMVEHMEALPSSLHLPTPRLDAFSEEALARCDVHPTHAQVQALAHVLGQSIETIIAWLKERGKIVAGVETVLPRNATTSVGQVGDVVVRKRHSLHVAGSQTLEAVHSSVSSSSTAKRTMFRWTPELIELLTDAFLSKSDGNVRATAQAIATEHGWPMKAVEYKIYDLHLLEKQQQPSLVAPVSLLDAVPHHEYKEAASLLVAEVPFVVQSGAFLWDIKVDGHFHRWGLDYPYGSFPLTQPGTHFVYQDHVYRLEQVSSAQLTVATLSSGSQEKTSGE